MSFTCPLFSDKVRCFNQSECALYGNFIIIYNRWATRKLPVSIITENNDKDFEGKLWKKFFFQCEKWLQERSSGTFSTRIIFMYILLTYNHTVFFFLVQFGINVHLCMGFSKGWNCTLQSDSCNFSFLKNSLVQINSKLNSKPYDCLYKQQQKHFFFQFKHKYCYSFSVQIK